MTSRDRLGDCEPSPFPSVESVEQSRNFFFSDAAGIQNFYQRLCAMPPY